MMRTQLRDFPGQSLLRPQHAAYHQVMSESLSLTYPGHVGLSGSQGAGPPHHQQPRRRWFTVALVVGALVTGTGSGLAIGHTIAPAVAPTPRPAATTPTPSVRAFAAADETWCREYQATSGRLADAGEAAGEPRHLEAQELPASSWTPDETAANRRFADYLATSGAGLAHLRETTSNPALKALIETSVAGNDAVVVAIRTGTYTPADFVGLRTLGATDRGILALCKELVG